MIKIWVLAVINQIKKERVDSAAYDDRQQILYKDFAQVNNTADKPTFGKRINLPEQDR